MGDGKDLSMIKCKPCLVTRRSDIHRSSPGYKRDTPILESQSTLLKDEPGIIIRAHSSMGISTNVIIHAIEVSMSARGEMFGTVEFRIGAATCMVTMVNMYITPA